MRKSPQALTTLRFKRIIALAVKRFSDTVRVFLVPVGRLGKLFVGGGRRNIGACLIAPRKINVLSDDLRGCSLVPVLVKLLPCAEISAYRNGRAFLKV